MTISDKDKRTLRLGGTVLAIYLVLFFGLKGWKSLEKRRTEFQQLVRKVEREQLETRRQENDVLLFEKLVDSYKLDPRKLPKETLVAEASAAIQNAARQGGFQFTSVREAAGQSGGRQLSTIQLDGMGPVPAALNLIHTLRTLGYPVVIDSLQLAQEASKPGMLKMNLVLVILNFEQWQKGSGPNA
jgi:hypothetical protein